MSIQLPKLEIEVKRAILTDKLTNTPSGSIDLEIKSITVLSNRVETLSSLSTCKGERVKSPESNNTIQIQWIGKLKCWVLADPKAILID